MTRLQSQDPAEVILVKPKAPGFTLGAPLFPVSPISWTANLIFAHKSQLLAFPERSDDVSKDQVPFFFHKVGVCVEISESFREQHHFFIFTSTIPPYVRRIKSTN